MKPGPLCTVGTKEVASGDLLDLVVEQGDLVRKAFGPGKVPLNVQCPMALGQALVADRAGNFWCIQRRDASWSIRAAAGRTPARP